jgi:hypothetical protein
MHELHDVVEVTCLRVSEQRRDISWVGQSQTNRSNQFGETRDMGYALAKRIVFQRALQDAHYDHDREKQEKPNASHQCVEI